MPFRDPERHDRRNSRLGVIELLWAASLFACLLSGCASARDELRPEVPALVDGVEQLQAGGLEPWRIKTQWVAGQPFGSVVRAESQGGSRFPWSVLLRSATTLDVAEGDVVFARFYARTVASDHPDGLGWLAFHVSTTESPVRHAVLFPTKVPSKWTRFDVPFVAGCRLPARTSEAGFWLGFDDAQVLEVGGLEITRQRQGSQVADFPATRWSYAGDDVNAPWRAAAAARIEQHRKADLDVAVTDSEGRPVPGAQVSVTMTRHAFLFGTNVSEPHLLAGRSVDADSYRELIPRLFNTAVVEHSLSWTNSETAVGPFTPEIARYSLDLLERMGLRVRGHGLVSTAWPDLPPRVRALENDPDALHVASVEHARSLVAAHRGKLAHWDVVSDTFANQDLFAVLGRQVTIDWLRAAREADPAARLYVTEDYILSGGDDNRIRRDYFEQLIRYLLRHDAPIDGIGVEVHSGQGMTSPQKMLETLDRLAEFRKPILVTAFDFAVGDEGLQGRYTRDFLTTLFSHPAVQGVTVSDYWDGTSSALMYRKDWTLKPAGAEYWRLVLDRWWTREAGTTDAEGRFGVRAFLGDYEILVHRGGHSARVAAVVGPLGSSVNVQLDRPPLGPPQAQSRPLRISYHAGPGCPSEPIFVEQLLRRTTRGRLATPDERGADVAVTLETGGTRVTGTLTLTPVLGAPSTRSVTGVDCRQVAEALALVAALAVNGME